MPGLLRRRLPDRAARPEQLLASTCWRIAARPRRGPRRLTGASAVHEQTRSRRRPARDLQAVTRPETALRDRDRRHLRRRRRRHRGRRPRRRADEAVGRRRPTGPRWSAASAGSPGCSTPPPSSATSGRCWPRPPTASAPRSRSPQAHGHARHDRHRPGRHGRRRPGGVRRRAAVHDRLHRVGKVRAGAGRRRSSRASPRAACWPAARWSAARPPSTRACWAPTSTTWRAPATGVVEADELLGAERVRAGDVVIAMAVLRAALQRLLAGAARAAERRPAGSSTARSPSSAARWARSCSSRPGSTRWTAWR